MDRRKIALRITAFVAIIALIGTVYAAYWIWDQTTVTVSKMSISLDASPPSVIENQTVTLQARLLKDTTPAVGKTIYFYRGPHETGTLLGTNVTDSDGYAYWHWKATINGTIIFEAGYQVP